MTLTDAATFASAAVDRMTGASRAVHAGVQTMQAFLAGPAVETEIGEIQGRLFTISPGDPRFRIDTRIAELQARLFTISPGDPRFAIDTRIAEIQARGFTLSPGDPRFQIDTRVAEIQADIFTAEPGDPRFLMFTRPSWATLARGARIWGPRPFGGRR